MSDWTCDGPATGVVEDTDLDEESMQRVLDEAGLDDDDKARVFAAFSGVGGNSVPLLHYIPSGADGAVPAYVFDEVSGMVYILD